MIIKKKYICRNYILLYLYNIIQSEEPLEKRNRHNLTVVGYGSSSVAVVSSGVRVARVEELGFGFWGGLGLRYGDGEGDHQESGKYKLQENNKTD